MAVLLVLLLAAPPAVNKVPNVFPLLKTGDTKAALSLLKEIGTHKKNHEEANALVSLIKTRKVKKPPEVMEACFLALKGIGSRKVTRKLIGLLKHSTLKKITAVRVGICRALGGSADPAAVEALIRRMRDKEDQVIAAAAEAAGAYRYQTAAIRKDLFKTILNIYESTWNLKNSVKPDLKIQRARADRKWEIIERPMERSMQLLSNITQNDPPAWRRWWNKNKRKKWVELEN